MKCILLGSRTNTFYCTRSFDGKKFEPISSKHLERLQSTVVIPKQQEPKSNSEFLDDDSIPTKSVSCSQSVWVTLSPTKRKNLCLLVFQ